MRYQDEERVKLVIYVDPTTKTQLQMIARSDGSSVSYVARRTLKKIAHDYIKLSLANRESAKADYAKLVAAKAVKGAAA